MTGAPKSGPNLGSCFSTLVVLALLGGGGYAAYKYGPAILEKFRMTTDAENAAAAMLHELPATFQTDAALKEQAGIKANDVLEGHHAKKYKWYVAIGAGGGRAPQVVRDDQLDDAAKTFFNGLLADVSANESQLGEKYDAKTRPLGAKWKVVKAGDEQWKLLVGWKDPAE